MPRKKQIIIEEIPEIEKMRHSASHVLAQAVLKYFPDAKLGIGPAIDNGFYYDIEFTSPLTEEDLIKIEVEMKEIIKNDIPFKQKFLSRSEAKKYFESKDQTFKLDLLKEIPDKKLSFFVTGNDEFMDLCRGPHIESTGKIGAIKLRSIAGAYWRGDEKEKMLTRIYGLAFENEEELQKYITMMEEAEKRDHRVLGPKLGLFMFHDTAPGMPYWLPKGLKILNKLIDFWRAEHEKYGYQEICSPLINKSELWKISGHWEHYKDNMFIADMGENEVYGVKAMNCPNAMIVFQSRQVSYKDLPLRLSDCDRLHRYEKSGTLNGLLRVRAFQQDDSHNFISEDMIESEYMHVFELCEKFYGLFDMEYSFRMGTRPEKYMGDLESWEKAEKALKNVLEKSGKPFTVLEGDGAFYGPKVDILMKDVLGREWQMGTIQLDYQLPKNFDLKYTDNEGKKVTPIVVHRVIYGSLERFMGILIEHYGGAFPLWISPVHAVVIPIADRHLEYAQTVVNDLASAGMRIEMDNRSETLQSKIRDHEMEKVPYILIVGDKEIDTQTVSVRSRSTKEIGLMKETELKDKLVSEINNKGKK
ncbi:threonine--tRNA ligase [Candidatus Dojkabacteria bacterium]|jgi:threonyl-tRNA synthetase|nr:threonine--tRNA ligase [Candidatus Dojkabacteria bacterium]